MEHQAEEASFNIKRILKLVSAKIHIVVIALLVSATIAIGVGYSLPKQYSASATVYIEQSVINDLVRGIAITPSMSAKVKVLKVTMLSRSMLLNVIKALDMDLHTQNEQALENYVKGVRNRVTIALNERKGLFTISFVDTSPTRARDFVNTLTRTYIEESTNSKREEAFEATRFLADQIEVFRKRIEQAQAEIDAFKTKQGEVLNSNEMVIRQEIQLAEAKLQSLRVKKNELTTKRGLLLRNTPLRTRLENLEADEAALLVNYTAKHPEVLRVREKIEAAKQEMARGSSSERKAVYGSAAYLGTKVELDAVEEMEKGLLASIDENTALLKKIPSVTTELSELRRKKKNETIIYEQLVSRYGKSEVSKQMELQDKAVTFKVIDPATEPSSPKSPNRVLIIFAGMLLGSLAGAGIIVLRDFLDGRVKSYEDLAKLGLPIMAVIPDMDDLAGNASVLHAHWKLFVFAGIYLTGVFAIIAIEYMQLPYIEKLLSVITGIL